MHKIYLDLRQICMEMVTKCDSWWVICVISGGFSVDIHLLIPTSLCAISVLSLTIVKIFFKIVDRIAMHCVTVIQLLDRSNKMESNWPYLHQIVLMSPKIDSFEKQIKKSQISFHMG